MFKTIVFAVAATVAVSAPMHASAGPATVPVRSERVPYGDLDLKSDAGAQAMLNRLAQATNRVCGGRPAFGAAFHAQNRAWKICRTDSLKRAVATLGSPGVTRLYAEANPKHPIEVAQR